LKCRMTNEETELDEIEDVEELFEEDGDINGN
jgi:hypothetical protein